MKRDCGIEQMEARLAHNQEVAGSNPAPAIFISRILAGTLLRRRDDEI